MVAVGFTLAGDAMTFALWGFVWYPGGETLAKLFWITVNTLALSLAAGGMVGFIVGNRYRGTVAGVVAALCYATVMIAGLMARYELDLAFGLFRVSHDPVGFILTGMLPALVCAPFYGWLLHSRVGQSLLSRLGL